VLLAVDVGNTQTHLGLFRGADLTESWRVATVRSTTGDELAALLSRLLDLRGLALDDIDGAIVSSVVPQLAHEYEFVSERYLRGRAAVVGPSMRSGMPIRISNPRELGTDRLVNAIAAYHRVGGAAIVVDFGTSINYDVVSERGEYLGGIIAPGVEISLAALAERAARLSKIEIGPPSELIGRTTEAAVRSGLVFGFAGQVDGIVRRVRDELGTTTRAIATGGLASVVVPHCREIDEEDDLLTLTGLRLIWERNAAEPSLGAR